LTLGFVTEEQFDSWVCPADMTHPLESRKGIQEQGASF
jgi:hypothetical protein